MLTREQALDILGLFGGQYPWNDVNGFLLALDSMGLLIAGSVASSEPAPSTGGVDTSFGGQTTTDPAGTTSTEAPNA
jgi:hypothetical protein